MKYRITGATFGLLLFCALQASSQSQPLPLNKPNYSKVRMFDDLPDRMPLRLTDFESILEQPIGARVNALVSRNFFIVGDIVSKSNNADPLVKSVVIKTTNRQGSIFTFTRITDADGNVSYAGRMMNRAGGDALEIAKEGHQYIIRKKGAYDLMNE